jgi:hypothetical protein
LPRVTVSRNWLGLSLSKCIRHGLVAKINGKRRLWACEALGQILADYSRVHRLAMPRPPREASERVCFSHSSLVHTLTSVKRTTYLIRRLHSTSTSKVELKSYHPPRMNESLRFIRNSLWARPNNSNNPPPDLKVSSRTLPHHCCFIYQYFNGDR